MKLSFRRILLLLMQILIHQTLNAQFYLTGEPPASIRWQQIKTNNFRIVFPEGLYKQANHFMNLLETTGSLTEKTFESRTKQMPVLMHYSTVLSNGYVAWAPRRMEIVAVPPGESYGQTWLAQLALHEYRHVVQINKLNQGFSRALSFIAGEAATGIISAMIPTWLYEGDAVVNETKLSLTGRGRLPSFDMPLRALTLMQSKPYSYDKIVFGSYRDYTPDLYQVGYHIVKYGMARFGDDIWAKAFDYTARNPYLITPLALFLKKTCEVNKVTLYNQAMDSLKYLYEKKQASVTYTNYSRLTGNNNKSYTQYLYPRFISTGEIVTVKRGIDQLDEIVLIDSRGTERKILNPGLLSGSGLSTAGFNVVWTETVLDPRWERRSYSEVRIFDMEKTKVRTLRKRSRLLSPDLSADGKYITAIENDMEGNQFLVIYETISGDVVQRLRAPSQIELQSARWSASGSIIVLESSDRGKRMSEVDRSNETWTPLMSFTFFNLADPVSYKEYILFRSSYNGTEDIFALNKKNGQILQVTCSQFGAFYPAVSPDSLRLVYSNYSTGGFDLVETDIRPENWKPVTFDGKPDEIWANTDESTQQHLVPEKIQEKYYEAKPYSKITHLLNFHSRIPFYSDFAADPNLTDADMQAGFMLFSQNLLGTSVSSLGYGYANGYHFIRPSFKYSGIYPVLEMSGLFRYNFNKPVFQVDSVATVKSGMDVSFAVSSFIPLFFTRGKYLQQLQAGIEYAHNLSPNVSGEGIQNDLDLLHFRFFVSNFSRSSARDLFPRIGQYLSFQYSLTPFDNKKQGNVISANTGLFLPGLLRHHHFMIRAGIQLQERLTTCLPINRIPFPRGFQAGVSKSFRAFALDYAFPLCYPDWSVHSVVYLKRITIRLFYDFAYGEEVVAYENHRYNEYTGKYRSFGAELRADFHPFRFIFPITAGLRSGYKPGPEKFFTEFLFSIDTGFSRE